MPSISLAVSLRGQLLSSVKAFDPISLFAANEPGVWYDPSDLTTLFQDTAGTTPVTTPGQTVALALDKSKGLVLGPELVTNGGFTSDLSGWSNNTGAAWDAGGALLTTAAADARLAQSFATVVGRTYRLNYQFVSGNTGNSTLRVGTSVNDFTSAFIGMAVGSFSRVFTATATTTWVTLVVSYPGININGKWDNISVKELPGFHATQATSASRPTYGVVPATGRRNLLTFTEQFDNAAWVKAGGAVSADADGVYDRFTPTAATANANIGVVSGPFVLGVNTVSVDFKASSVSWARIRIATGAVGGNTATGSRPANSWANFNLSNGTVGTVGPGGGTSSITDLGNGYYRCSYSFNCTLAGTLVIQFMALQSDSTADFPSFTWGGADSLLLGRGQAETGSTATNYQRVGSSFDVTEAGVPSLHYLSFDGVDDFLVTPTITPGVDKAQVFAGVRKLSDAAGAILVESSASYSSNNGAFYMAAPESNVSSERYSFCGRGNAESSTAHRSLANAGAAPDQAVLTGQGNISADSNIIRRNGVAFPAGTFDQGTGNYLAYPLYIGRRGGTTVPLNGQIFSLIVRFGANLTADQITSTETWVNGKTRAY